MIATKLHLAPADLEALDILAARHGHRGLRARGGRSATVRALIQAAMAAGCLPEPPGADHLPRCCIACGHSYTGPLDCPLCGEPGEPVPPAKVQP